MSLTLREHYRRMCAGKIVANDRARQRENGWGNTSWFPAGEINDEFLKVMFSICEFRCLYDEKLKEDKDHRKKMTAWKEISERVGIPVESYISYNIQNFCLVIRPFSSFPLCCFLFRTSNKNKTSLKKWQLNYVQIRYKFYVNVSPATNRYIVADIFHGLHLLTDFTWTRGLRLRCIHWVNNRQRQSHCVHGALCLIYMVRLIILMHTI